jgi:hypothetical protein
MSQDDESHRTAKMTSEFIDELRAASAEASRLRDIGRDLSRRLLDTDPGTGEWVELWKEVERLKAAEGPAFAREMKLTDELVRLLERDDGEMDRDDEAG